MKSAYKLAGASLLSIIAACTSSKSVELPQQQNFQTTSQAASPQVLERSRVIVSDLVKKIDDPGYDGKPLDFNLPDIQYLQSVRAELAAQKNNQYLIVAGKTSSDYLVVKVVTE